jgi:hypothetical protein
MPGRRSNDHAQGSTPVGPCLPAGFSVDQPVPLAEFGRVLRPRGVPRPRDRRFADLRRAFQPAPAARPDASPDAATQAGEQRQHPHPGAAAWPADGPRPGPGRDVVRESRHSLAWPAGHRRRAAGETISRLASDTPPAPGPPGGKLPAGAASPGWLPFHLLALWWGRRPGTAHRRPGSDGSRGRPSRPGPGGALALRTTVKSTSWGPGRQVQTLLRWVCWPPCRCPPSPRRNGWYTPTGEIFDTERGIYQGGGIG